MKSNREILIERLEQLGLLDGRYENLRCVNFNAASGQKRGNFSLVFRADDRLTGHAVAIKFFDPDPQFFLDPYRRDAFAREPEIVRALLGKKRCLQLVAGLKTFNLDIPAPGNGGTATLPCQYFVIEWLPSAIDEFFERQHEFNAIDKLLLFIDIVMAVEALHVHEVFHRDVKVDNLRAYQDALKRIVVAIDLGTAARFDSVNIGLAQQYAIPVGHLRYSAPEAWCGLSGHRRVAHHTDVYALGCLLYELFNKDLFDTQVHRDRNYKIALAVLSFELARHDKVEAKLQAWRDTIRALRPSIASIPATTPGHSVPAAIQDQLNQLVCSLTRFDFDQRPSDLEAVRERIWSMIRLMENQTSERRAIMLRRLYRQRRIEKIRRREQKLREFLSKSRGILC